MFRARSYYTRSATFNATFGSTFGRGQRNQADPVRNKSALTAYWSNCFALPDYQNAVIRIRRSSDNAELDLFPDKETGFVSPEAIRSFNGWNLFSQTAAFTNAAWVKNSGTLLVSAADSQADAFGGATASTLTPAAGTGSAHVLQNGNNYTIGLNYCQSFDVKANGCDWIQITGSTGFSTGNWKNFNISTGATGNGNDGTSIYSITSLGSGWYRISYAMPCTSSATSSRFILSIHKTDVASRLAATDTFNGTDGILIARPQYEIASAFTTYEPRTTTGAGSSFLVTRYDQMSAGRNLLNKSEEFTNSAWGNSVTGTGVAPVLTANAGTPPVGSGALTATRMQFDLGGGTTSGDITRRIQNYTPTAVPHTFSIWIRSYDGVSSYNMHLVGVTGTTRNIVVTGTWQRFEFTDTGAGVSVSHAIGLRGGQTPANSNTADVLVTGAQLELGSVATAYERRSAFGAGQGHATQATTTLQPIVCESGVPVVNSGGRLTGRFVAADARRLAVANSTNIYNFLHTTGGTVLAVSQANDTAANKAILANTTGSSLAGFALLRESVSERTQIFTSRIDVAGVATTGTSVSQTAANDEGTILNSVLVINIDPDNASAASRVETFQNGTKITVDNAATDIPFVENAGGNMTIGARSGASIPHDGTIGDIGIWDGFLSQEDRVRLTFEMGAIHGITVTAPISITSHPASALGYAGDTVSFSITATNASDYSWQVSTDNGTTWQPTGTNASTISVLLASNMNGWLYRCLAGNRSGSVVSNNATLTVPVAPLDVLPASQSAWSFSEILSTSGRNNAIGRIRRSTDNTETDVFRSGTTGLVDTAAIRTFNGWNLLANSHTFTSTWSQSRATVALAVGQSPPAELASSVSTVYTVTCDATAATTHRIFQAATAPVGDVNGLVYTATAWVKKTNSKNILLRINNSSESATRASAFLDFDTGVLNVTSGSGSVTALADGWFRVSLTATMQTGDIRPSLFVFVLRDSSTGTTYDGDSTTSYNIAAAQIELASSYSTYEPRTTTGAGSSFWVTLYDQSGNGHHHTQATTTLQPIACESGVVVTENALSVAKFVAADARRMAVPSSTALYNFLHTTGGTVAAVCRANDTAEIKVIARNTVSGVGSGFGIQRSTAEQITAFAGRLNVAGVATNGNSVVVTTTTSGSLANAITVAQYDADNVLPENRMLIWHNGTVSEALNVESGTPFVQNAFSDITLGARPDGTSAFDGTIASVIIWDTFLTTAQRQILEAHWGSRYNITVT